MADEKNVNNVLDERNLEFAALQDFFGKDFMEEADYIAEKLELDPEIVQKALDACEAFSRIAEGNPEYIVEELDEDMAAVIRQRYQEKKTLKDLKV